MKKIFLLLLFPSVLFADVSITQGGGSYIQNTSSLQSATFYVSSGTVSGPLTVNNSTFRILGPSPVNYLNMSLTNTVGTISFFQSGTNDHRLQFSNSTLTIPSDDVAITGGNLSVSGSLSLNSTLSSIDPGSSVGSSAPGILELWAAAGQKTFINFNEHGVANRGALGYLGGSGTLIYQPSVNILGNGTTRFSIDTAGVATFTAPAVLKGYTVATLPAGVQGMAAFVTDALAPTFGSTIVGGGSVVSVAFYNGSAWIAF